MGPNERGPDTDVMKERLYHHQLAVIATMHQKEQVIGPVFSQILGLNSIPANIDTDQLGTFTAEVERKTSALTCARQKCELAISATNIPIAAANEGSFGPHPFIPCIASDHEILYFIDQERNLALHHTLVTTNTNYDRKVISNLSILNNFAKQVLFPSHALIVRPNNSNQVSKIYKGIQNRDALERIFLECCALSDDKQALVETDMRAHMNPTRMGVIKQLAYDFAKRLATPCPFCNHPGWSVVEKKAGLECAHCGSETDMIRSYIFGCSKCHNQQETKREDGMLRASAQYCSHCNP